MMKKIIVLLVALCAGFNIFAVDFTVDGISYNITSATKPYTVEVTRSISMNSYTGSVNIPANVTYNGIDYSVSTLGYLGFQTSLTSISLPVSITSIGDDAFGECFLLTSVSLPDSLTSIGNNAFYKCYNLTSINLPSSLTSIGVEAFYNCFGLTSISLPASLTSIGGGAFEYCHGLTSVSIPASLTSVGGMVFKGCKRLKTINLPNSLTSIGSNAFEDCSVLTSISLPTSLTSIGDYAFAYCKGLTSISLPVSLTSVGSHAFRACTGLTSIYAYFVNPAAISLSNNVSYDVNKYGCTLYVPASSKALYQVASQWRDFKNIVEVNPEILANAGPDQKINEGQVVTLDGTNSKSINNGILSYKWTAPPGITLSSVTASNPTFTAPEVSIDTDYTFELTVSDGLVNSMADLVKVRVKQVNKAPIANAGTDQSVNENSLVTLNGSASTDPDQGIVIVGYLWTAPAGITLSSENASKPTFTAPEVSIDTVYTFELTVYDNSANSQADQVKVTVKQVNKAPIANAGTNQSVNENSVVTLFGSASTDPDQDELSYLWTAPAGITLSSETESNPSFIAPEASIDTVYTFELSVNDGSVNSTVDQVKVTVKQLNKAPTANSGTNQSVNENSLVTLDGSESTDPDQDELTYLWTAPTGITLSSETAKNPTFTAPEVSQDNIYRFILVVNDGRTDSDTSQVSIVVKQVLPVLKLVSKTSDSQISSNEIAYQFYLKTGNSFSEESVTPVINGDTTEFSLDPGEWIILASPAQNSSAFVPTYSGNTLEWINAEHIIIPEKGIIFKEITCLVPEVVNKGTGQISGYVYEDSGTKNISITNISEASGNPVPGALIRLFKKGNTIPVLSIFTDAQGFYKFEQLEISEYQIEVEIPGFTQSEKFGIAIFADQPLATASFGVNTTSQVITDNNTLLISSLKIYPNPVVKLVTLEVRRNINSPHSFLVYSIDGELMMNQVAIEPKTNLDFSKLLAGSYLIQVCSGAERQSAIIIKR